MAYNLSDRFRAPPKYFPFYDPGTYQFEKHKLKENKVAFLSNVPRKTGQEHILWTQSTYNAAVLRKIPNITSFKSKQQRFPYEVCNEEAIKEMLCKCGLETQCVCPKLNEPIKDIDCQGKVRRRLYKGPGPRSALGDEGLSAPSRNDHGFSITNSGLQKRIRDEIKSESLPFYDSGVNEFTAYYKGCKWSHRSSKRSHQPKEETPGPSDYYFERKPSLDEICQEKLRAYKRKISKQPRFIEMVQQQNIRDGRPGPASYRPTSPKGTCLKFLGPKDKRFHTLNNPECPGPAQYWLKREFDSVDPPGIACKATLPEPACFGNKSQRFTPLREEGPSPAAYNVSYTICRFVHCRKAAFGSSAQRFKDLYVDDTHEEEIIEHDLENETSLPCPRPMWAFKSKTIRMKPLVKNMNEPSPADIMINDYRFRRSADMQYAAPFFSSDGRFHVWYNWIPVQDMFRTPTPCDYNPTIPKCNSAFNVGPMFRSKRFANAKQLTPAPNAYKISNGIETVLKTHNKKLNDNIENQHQFKWEPPLVQKRIISYEEKESLLIQKCIRLLEPTEIVQCDKKNNTAGGASVNNSIKLKDRKDYYRNKDVPKGKKGVEDKTTSIMENKPKLLRTFLCARQVPCYF